MDYVLVYVSEIRYKKSEPLTYVSKTSLERGSIVIVPYGKKKILGVVANPKVDKPNFNTKEIINVLDTHLLPEATMQLLEWMHSYYPEGGSVTQLFLPTGIEIKNQNKKQEKSVTKLDLPTLTEEQTKAIEIIDSVDGAFILHGETGSGKSRIYIEEARKSISQNKSVLILTPEISLVPQLEQSFRQYFDEVLVIHSGLTKATKSKNWKKILNNDKPQIIIGTRSAIFAPIKNLGLVVVDEMHEPSYKQDSVPRYYGLRAAGKLAKIYDAKIIYGSATPSISEYYFAEKTNSPIIRMSKSAIPSKAIKSTVVDLKDKTNFSKSPYLSDLLIKSISLRLSKNEQSLLFLNRRGTARQIICNSCGWQAMCPNCDTPVIYHGDKHIVRCHTCGYSNKPPYKCQSCGNNEINYRSLGTKALAETIQSIFPEAKIQRFDTDNTTEEKLIKHYESVKAGDIDILVGTQMLGKGLDLPKLSLVGIINADTGLGMPDFSSNERGYQLLHQAIGRVGRGHINGEVIIQTFNPKSPLISASLNRDWTSLYNNELDERKKYMFPPFCFLMKIKVSRKTSVSAEKFIKDLHTQALKLGLKLQINEPTPSFYEKSHGNFNWQMIIKSKQRSLLIDLVTRLKSGDWTYDIDPINLL